MPGYRQLCALILVFFLTAQLIYQLSARFYPLFILDKSAPRFLHIHQLYSFKDHAVPGNHATSRPVVARTSLIPLTIGTSSQWWAGCCYNR